MWITRLALIVVLTSMLGCGPKAIAPPDPSLKAFADRIALVAKSGEGGSGLEGVKFSMEALRTSSPELASSIEKDYKAVMTAPSDAKRKTAAVALEKKLQAAQTTAQ